MKRKMFDYIQNNIKFITQVDSVISKRGVLCFLQQYPGSTMLSVAEIKQHTDICYCCTRVLNWLSKINLESEASRFGIDDFYSFRDGLCELNDLLNLMIEYYEMCSNNEIDRDTRQTLERISDRDEFIEVFRDEKVSISENSDESVLAPPIKEMTGMNLYIEIGKKSFVCEGIRNYRIRELTEYKNFKKDKNIDTLMELLRTGEVETLFNGCIAVEDYDVFSEIAEAEVEFRGDQCHYCSYKLALNKSKYDKIASVAEDGSFLLLYSTIDNVDGDIYCEYSGMDVEVSKTKFRNYVGIFRGTCSDRRGDYNFIVDTNVD